MRVCVPALCVHRSSLKLHNISNLSKLKPLIIVAATDENVKIQLLTDPTVVSRLCYAELIHRTDRI